MSYETDLILKKLSSSENYFFGIDKAFIDPVLNFVTEENENYTI